MADTLVIVFILSFLIPAVALIKLILPSNKFIKKSDNFTKGRFTIIIIHLIFFKIAFFSSFNFAYISTLSQQSAYSSFAAVLGIAFVVIVPAFYAV